jgi:phage shock protein A
MMDELKGEIARKKMVSTEVKDLRATIAANEAEAAQLAAQQQHLKRQIASLQERLQRLEAQVTKLGCCSLAKGRRPLVSILPVIPSKSGIPQ